MADKNNQNKQNKGDITWLFKLVDTSAIQQSLTHGRLVAQVDW